MPVRCWIHDRAEPEKRSDKAGIEWVYYLDRTAADFLVLTFEGDRLMHIRVSRD